MVAGSVTAEADPDWAALEPGLHGTAMNAIAHPSAMGLMCCPFNRGDGIGHRGQDASRACVAASLRPSEPLAPTSGVRLGLPPGDVRPMRPENPYDERFGLVDYGL